MKRLTRACLVAAEPVALAVAFVTALGSCGDPALELRGELRRVVGESVTLALVQGDPVFSDALSLADAANRFPACLRLVAAKATICTIFATLKKLPAALRRRHS